MNPRRPRKQMNNINVVPYIDVMLVLLIIFMVTAPMVNPGQVDLPSVAKTQMVALQPLQITLRANGELRVRDQALTNSDEKTVNKVELVRIIQQKQAEHPDQPVVIAADKSVRYEEVMKLMSLMQKNQVKRVGLLAAMDAK